MRYWEQQDREREREKFERNKKDKQDIFVYMVFYTSRLSTLINVYIYNLSL